ARTKPDVAHALGHFGEADEADVRQTETRADHRKAPDEEGGEAGGLDQPRRQSVVSARQNQGLILCQQLTPGRPLFPSHLSPLTAPPRLMAGAQPRQRKRRVRAKGPSKLWPNSEFICNRETI